MEINDDRRLVKEILELAQSQPKYVSSQLNRSLKYRDHFKLLCRLTEFAPLPKYPISEKIWLLWHNMTCFPTCKHCGKPLDEPGSFLGLTRGFRDFCSCSCSANSGATAGKRKQTVRSRYGTDNVFQNETVKLKCRETCNRNFGVPISTLNSDVMRRQRRSARTYSADDIRFDSSLECCFYVANRDMGILCEYSPDIRFEYECHGKKHWYFPDFKTPISGEIIEIKGAHFFKDGKMICPFRHRSWTDEQYALVCELYEAKHQCMLRNGIIILTENELKTELGYMKSKYGTRWRDMFRVNSIHEECSTEAEGPSREDQA